MPAQEERSAVVPPASGVKLTSGVGKPSGCVLLYSVRSVLFQVARECLAYILIRQPPCRLFILRDKCGSAVERSVNSCDGVEATCLGHREAQTVFVPAVLAKARRWVALTHSRSSEDIGIDCHPRTRHVCTYRHVWVRMLACIGCPCWGPYLRGTVPA